MIVIVPSFYHYYSNVSGGSLKLACFVNSVSYISKAYTESSFLAIIPQLPVVTDIRSLRICNICNRCKDAKMPGDDLPENVNPILNSR